MFARVVMLALAGLLAASPVLAVEGYEPLISFDTDKHVPEEAIATGTDAEVPVDAES